MNNLVREPELPFGTCLCSQREKVEELSLRHHTDVKELNLRHLHCNPVPGLQELVAARSQETAPGLQELVAA